MKKFAIACVAVLATAMSLTSCGDTNYCYEVTVTYKLMGKETSSTNKVWCTSNELDAVIAKKEAALEEIGVSKESIKTEYERTFLNQSDCK